MVFDDDGLTLTQYNATATGQRGPVLVVLIKSAAAIYGLSANPLALAAVAAPAKFQANLAGQKSVTVKPVSVTRYYFVCREDVLAGIKRLASVREEIAGFEGQSSASTPYAGPSGHTRPSRGDQTAIEVGLTLITKADALIEPSLSAGGPAGTMTVLIKPANYDAWFQVVRETREIDPAKVKSSRPHLR